MSKYQDIINSLAFEFHEAYTTGVWQNSINDILHERVRELGGLDLKEWEENIEGKEFTTILGEIVIWNRITEDYSCKSGNICWFIVNNKKIMFE